MNAGTPFAGSEVGAEVGDGVALLQLLEALLQTFPGALHVKDRDLRYRLVNRYFLERWNVTESEVLGRRAGEVFGAEITARSDALDRQVLERGEAIPFHQVDDLDPAGRPVTLWATKLPLHGADGSVAFVATAALDITERTREQREASQTRRLLEAVVLSALDAIVTIDEAGCVVEFNPAAEAAFGYRREEALGQPVVNLIVPPELRESHSRGLARYLRSDRGRPPARRLELEGQRRDGSRFPLELAITEVKLEGRRLFAAYLRDLTERKWAEEQLERQREAVHENEKMAAMGSLLTSVAHELNNPLSIVVGQAALLQERAAGSDLADRAAKIRDAAERCARIVRTFLAMARRRPPQRSRLDLREVVQAALELSAYALRADGVEMALDLPEEPVPVEADPDQIHQVVTNLVTNAQQALRLRRPPRRLSLSLRRDPVAGEAVLDVIDNGPGIAPEHAARIFEPFYTTKSVGEGTGIGLPVSRGLAEAHGGRLVHEPAPGGGACFRVALPLADAEPVPPPSFVAEEGGGLGRSALVVEDEPDIAAFIAELLQLDGFACRCVADGAAAIALLAEIEPAVIVSDLRMPGIDGLGLQEWLAEHRPELLQRLVLITGDVLSPLGRGVAGTGEVPLLEKPLDPAELRRSVLAVAATGQSRHGAELSPR